jgi:hypothetical protein
MSTQNMHRRLRILAVILLLIVTFNALLADYSFMVELGCEGLGIKN